MASIVPPNARFLDATQYSVSWFWKRLNSDELDMKPPYQRKPVWQEQQKAFLIDSIINGFPVPEIYLQTTTSPEGDEIHTLVDGQQRIRACMEFIGGEFPLGAATPEIENMFFEDLNEDIRLRIFRYKFVIRSLPELNEAEVREIFGRLNQNNVALNRQELRHSTYWGGFIHAMEEFAQDSFWIESGLFTTNAVRRMLDIEFVSEILIAGLYGPQNKKLRLDDYYARYEEEFPEYEYARRVFDKVIAQLRVLLEWPNSSRWGRKVDFYTLFVELWNEEERLPLNNDLVAFVQDRLDSMSDGVTRALSPDQFEHADQNPDFVMYARGVRNSSDIGSRRLRARGLHQHLWGEDIPTTAEVESLMAESAQQSPNPHLARLPSLESLMAPDAEEEEKEDDE